MALNMHSRLKFDIGWAPLLWAAIGGPVSRSRLERARAFIESWWSGRSAVVGLSERTLFDALLSELALPAGDRIIMSGVNIKNMADIADAHRLEIAPVDIDPATLSPPTGALLQAQAQTGARLCLVAQLYGAANAIADAADLRSRGVFVVEDAAQAFAGIAYKGDMGADATLFSFGPIKRRTSLGGGIGVFRDARLAERIRGRLARHSRRSELWLRQRAVKYVALKALTVPALYDAVIGAIRLAGKDPDKLIGESARGFSGPSLIDAIRGQPPDRMLALMARQIETADDASERRSICEAFLRRLPHGFTEVGRQAERHAFWLLPIRCSKPDDAIRFLRSRGFDATRGATSLRALAPDETPRASQLIDEVVYVPHPAGLSARARDHLVHALSAYAAHAAS